MSLAASICICAYNAKDRIKLVLQALAVQSAPVDSWELLIIDNASTDGTGQYSSDLAKEMLKCRARVVLENTPGLAFARQRAANEAEGEIVCFLDDDNIPARDFVACAIQAFDSRPAAGAIGGKIIADWETPPTALALAVQNFALAICDLGETSFKHEFNRGPVGAGLCIRSRILQAIYARKGAVTAAIGRKGKALGGGEDLAIGILTWQMGYECWYDPSLVIHHKLPTGRMKKEYLLRLYEGIGCGQAEVRRLYDRKARSPLVVLIGFKDYIRWVVGRWSGPGPEQRRRHPALARDLHDLNQRLLWGRSVRALGQFRQ
ncbi:MAG TPA: glycosyltransferase [Candidatus Angelobacter sp.]|jgi:glycosyltransferase involved in cell wall biosynthesis|nr:glycosyltransferase [Candidatus Angelobacter sp.]